MTDPTAEEKLEVALANKRKWFARWKRAMEERNDLERLRTKISERAYGKGSRDSVDVCIRESGRWFNDRLAFSAEIDRLRGEVNGYKAELAIALGHCKKAEAEIERLRFGYSAAVAARNEAQAETSSEERRRVIAEHEIERLRRERDEARAQLADTRKMYEIDAKHLMAEAERLRGLLLCQITTVRHVPINCHHRKACGECDACRAALAGKGESHVCPHCGDDGCAGAVYDPDDCPHAVYPSAGEGEKT